MATRSLRASSAALPLPVLLKRMVLYTHRHIQFNRRRSLLPITTVAAGTLLVYVVLTLIEVVNAQMAQFNGTLSPATAAAMGRATLYVAIICLIVGGLETAIVMTRSVLSRIQEIGVLKATGVSNAIVVGLFMTEAIIYGFLGGLVGVIVGWWVAAIAQMLSGMPLALLPVWQNAALALLLAVATSVVAALFPIWRTVRLSAIQAIYHQF
jgi:predicted lysophospholipase L1 biosynthesis ABC-type transport system permease subunit